MTITELLKTNGVTDDVVEKITNSMKENKIYTTNEENLDVRYGKLKTDHEAMTKQLGEANTLIEELKKSNKGNEDLQNKITGYEQQVQQLQTELQKTKVDAALKVALLSEHAADVDYLTYKLKEKGELTLDENDKIKGWSDKIAALKVQFPTQFENTGAKKFNEHKLEQGDNNGTTVTKEDFAKMNYASRVKLHETNPELYNELTK